MLASTMKKEAAYSMKGLPKCAMLLSCVLNPPVAMVVSAWHTESKRLMEPSQ